MKLTPHLGFNGTCREALDHYARCFGGTVDFVMTYAESPVPDMVGPEQQHHILHAHLTTPGFDLMGADAPATRPVQPSHATELNITVDTVDEVDSLLAALSEGGAIMMPAQKTFWADRFGTCKDRWGHSWMVGVFTPMADTPAAQG